MQQRLTPGWSNVLAAAWAGVCLGLGVVAISSRRMGLSTWWLGPETNPGPIVVTVLPFVLPAAATLVALSGHRRAPVLGFVAAAAVAAVALGDASQAPGFAAIEGMFAVGGFLVSLAATTGVEFSGTRDPSPQ
jgi:hypothetical protein